MTRPVGRIEIWETGGGAALYTIDDAVGIYYKETLTDGVGNFNFTCYSHKDFSGTYTYPDIDLHDTVKIWLDYDTIAGDPNFIGKVTKRSGPLLTQTGWVRKIAGLSLGEILLRRFKTRKAYTAVAASTIVTEWANDLSLGTGEIESEPIAVTLAIETKSYFDLLREISDYWYDASNQIKKDFYVDTNRNLVWKTRPLRTSGVESLSIADFLADPLVEHEIEPVKNKIYVWGAPYDTPGQPEGSWTESSPPTDWSTDGTLATLVSGVEVGQYATEAYRSGATSCYLRKTNIGTIRAKNGSSLNHYFKYDTDTGTDITACVCNLLAPGTSNYFTWDLGLSAENQWRLFNLPLGSDHQKSGEWTIGAGTPNWSNIQALEWKVTNDSTGGTTYHMVDGLYLHLFRYGDAQDISSQNTYAIREAEFSSNQLATDYECDRRANTLLYQLKDHPTEITVIVQGNDNVLVGDRLTMTIPSEGISGQPYDVIAVENLLNLDNWTTTITMVNSVNYRVPLKIRQQIETRRQIRQLMRQERTET